MTDDTRFRWLPTVSAPSAFPVRVIRGALLLADSGSLPLPERVVVANGWGQVGPVQLMGEELKTLPVRLSVTWLSYAENRTYQAELAVPIDSVSRLFAQGFSSPSTGQHGTWDRIIVGLAPGGVLAVWVSGEAGTHLVATGLATVTDLAWDQISDGRSVTREQHVDGTLREELGTARFEQLKREGIPKDFWRRAERRHAIDVTIVGGAARESVWIDYLNGERALLDLRNPAPEPDSPHAMAKRMMLQWTAHEGQRYTSTLELDADEALAAFEKLTSGQPGERVLVVVDLSAAPTHIPVSLRSGQLVLPLQKATVSNRAR